MSSNVCARIFLAISIVMISIFIILYFMFESFGIGEFVWPILWPILLGIFGMMVVIFGVTFALCRFEPQVSSDSKRFQRTYDQPMYRTGDYAEGSVYTVPVYCPHCKYKLEMNNVEWVGSSEMTCPNCFRVIEAGIRENL